MKNINLSTYQQTIRFRKLVLVFFLCLILPLAMVVYYGFQKFENEMLFQYRWKSANVVTQINKVINKRIITEEQRPPLDYYYYQNIANLESSNTSPLSYQRQPHYQTDLFGLVGFFNIVNKKVLNTPILPFVQQPDIIRIDQKRTRLELTRNEINARLEKITLLKKILIDNGLLQHSSNKELNDGSKPTEDTQTNDSQVGRFNMLVTDENQFIFYRKVNINQQVSVQGFVVNRKEFLEQLLSDYIKNARYDNSVQVQLFDTLNKPKRQYYQYNIDELGEVTVKVSIKEHKKLLSQSLFKGELIEPFANISLAFTTGSLPLGPATSFVFLFILVLSSVIIIGSFGFYWLGIKQISLAEQRMNFVSSVSHELKTPLTSILMCSEMLKSGMVPDKQNRNDYHHFIFDESERLSRLINNILQLSSLSRNQDMVMPEYVSIEVLKDIIQSKVSSLIIKNNFQLNFIINTNVPSKIHVFIDLDAFSQIVINLIDNAVKFYKAAKINDPQRQKIDVIFSLDDSSNDKINFSIRDYGPGISNSQLDKIFELFYRCGNEMTRTTSGTGIGLALVHQLVIAQDGEIKVTRHSQGVSFDLAFLALQR